MVAPDRPAVNFQSFMLLTILEALYQYSLVNILYIFFVLKVLNFRFTKLKNFSCSLNAYPRYSVWDLLFKSRKNQPTAAGRPYQESSAI